MFKNFIKSFLKEISALNLVQEIPVEPVTNNVDWNNVYGRIEIYDEKAFDFIFSEADKMLNETIKIDLSFRDRASSILSILIPTILAIIGFYFSAYPSFGALTTIVSSTCLTSGAFFCLKILNTKSSYVPGCKPLGILKNTDLIDIKNIIFTQCEEYEKRIQGRMNENIKAGNNFRICVQLLFITPIVTVTTVLLEKVFNYFIS